MTNNQYNVIAAPGTFNTDKQVVFCHNFAKCKARSCWICKLYLDTIFSQLGINSYLSNEPRRMSDDH